MIAGPGLDNAADRNRLRIEIEGLKRTLGSLKATVVKLQFEKSQTNELHDKYREAFLLIYGRMLGVQNIIDADFLEPEVQLLCDKVAWYQVRVFISYLNWLSDSFSYVDM